MRNSTGTTSVTFRSAARLVPRDLLRDLRRSEIIGLLGGISWALLWFVFFRRGGTLSMIEAILGLSILVIVPLLLGLISESDLVGAPDAFFRRCLAYYPVAAVPAAVGLLAPIGTVSGAAVVPWLVFTGVLGIGGLRRILRLSWRPASACITAALVYLPVGGTWLCLSRFGVDPMGVGEPIVVLTAVHFHYAGFALPILAALATSHCEGRRSTPHRWGGFLCYGAVSGVALTAVGISLSPLLEIVAVAIVAVTVVGLSLLIGFSVVPNVQARLARTFLSLSAICATFPIFLALVYAVGELTETTLVPIPLMVAAHGWVNAVGFVLAGVLGWTVFDRSRRHDTNLKDGER